MATALNKEQIQQAAEKYVNLSSTGKSEFLATLPGVSRTLVVKAAQNVKPSREANKPFVFTDSLTSETSLSDMVEKYTAGNEKDREAIANYVVKQGEKVEREFKALLAKNKNVTPINSNPKKMATEAATRKSKVVLDPANNAHKVVLFLNKMQFMGNANKFKDFGQLPDSKKGLDADKRAEYFYRQFETFKRKLKEHPDVSKSNNPLHEQALKICKEFANLYAGGEGAKEALKQNETFLNRIEAVYATEKKGGTGAKPRAKFNVDSPDKDLFSFL